MVRDVDAICASKNKKLADELKGWLDKYRAYGEMGVAYIGMEEAYATGQDVDAFRSYRNQYKVLQQSLASNPRIVSGPIKATMGDVGSLTGRGVLAPFFDGLDARIEELKNLME